MMARPSGADHGVTSPLPVQVEQARRSVML
jgi:hypothetical protein